MKSRFYYNHCIQWAVDKKYLSVHGFDEEFGEDYYESEIDVYLDAGTVIFIEGLLVEIFDRRYDVTNNKAIYHVGEVRPSPSG